MPFRSRSVAPPSQTLPWSATPSPPPSHPRRRDVLRSFAVTVGALALCSPALLTPRTAHASVNLNGWIFEDPVLVGVVSQSGGGTVSAYTAVASNGVGLGVVSVTGDGTNTPTTVTVEFSQVVHATITATNSKPAWARANVFGWNNGNVAGTGHCTLMGYIIDPINYNSNYSETTDWIGTFSGDAGGDCGLGSHVLYKSVGSYTIHFRIQVSCTGTQTAEMSGNMKGTLEADNDP